jgi:hypothetical protein
MANPGLTQDEMLEALRLVSEYGSVTEAARRIGMNRETFKSRYYKARDAASTGTLNEDLATRVPAGHKIKGVSTLYGDDGAVRAQWVKTDVDKSLVESAFASAIGDLCERIPPAPFIPPPTSFDDDLLNVIPMGDPHFGLRTWKPETGEDFDLSKAEEMTFGAVDKLVSRAPPACEGLLLNLGDYFHADDSSNRTPRSSHALDVDGRFQKIASVGFRAMLRCVERMLETHERVTVRNNPGNHDPHQALMLNIAVGARFHDNPRVYVDPSPSSFYYYRFGKVLIGSTHGDGAKMGDLPLIMAADVPQEWAAAEFRVWHVGHFHHNQRIGQKDLTGCEVETHRTLAAGDAWHRHQGYRALRDMKVISYHREYGEDLRIRCGVERLAA